MRKFPAGNDHHNILNDARRYDKQVIPALQRERQEYRDFSCRETEKEKRTAVLKRYFYIDIMILCVIETEDKMSVSNWKMGKV